MFLFFITWGFYGTDSIHGESDGTILFFKIHKKEDRAFQEEMITLWTNACPPSLKGKRSTGHGRVFIACETVYWLHVGSYENIFGTGNFGDVVIYERCDRSMGSKPYQVLMNGLIHSEIAAIFDREMQNPFKRSIAIKF